MIAYIHKIDFELITRGFLVDVSLPDPMSTDAMTHCQYVNKEIKPGFYSSYDPEEGLEEVRYHKAQFLVDGRIIIGWVRE